MRRFNIFRKIKKLPSEMLVIFTLGFLLRVIGIWHGLPLQLDMDEPTLVSSVISLKYNINPGHFDWPHLYFYFNAIFYFIYALVKRFFILLGLASSDSSSLVAYYLISRTLSVIFGSFSIIAIYVLGKEIFNKKTGILSALILAFLPVHVYESHFARLDVAQTFFAILAVYFIYRTYKYQKKTDYIYSGLLIGIATSIKYNGILLFLPFFLSVVIKEKSLKNIFVKSSIKNYLYLIITTIITFYLGTPFALLDYKTFFSSKRAVGALWQFKNVGSVPWSEYSVSVYKVFVTMFSSDFGYGIWILFVLLILHYLFFNRRSEKYNIFFLSFIILALYISKGERSPSHYFLFLIPLYIPFIADYLLDLQKKFFKKINLKFIVFIVMLPSVIASSIITYKFFVKDTRSIAYEWVQNNLDDSKDYLYVYGEDLSFVPFQKNNTERIPKIDRGRIDSERSVPFYLVIGKSDVTLKDVTTWDKDPDSIRGNSRPILRNADLLLYANNKFRFGPPIYIFKVNKIEKEK